MSFPWPPFLSRALLLRRARLALESGDWGRCLDLVRDPSLALSERAEQLRRVALEQSCREARRLSALGETAGADGIVARLSVEDPHRASEVRRELGLPLARPRGERMGDILAQVRASIAVDPVRVSSAIQAGSGRTGIAPLRATIPSVVAPPSHAPESDPEVVRFHVAVDDGGEFFVVGGAELILGHLRSEAASLPFLADVENRHVRFMCSESFHAGIQWRLERLAARNVRINGETLGEKAELLSDGDEVVLAQNLRLRFRQPDSTSGSAVLDLSAGAECQGVRRIVLLARGEAGRVRIGSKTNRHIPVPNLAHEIELEWVKDELRVRCAGGVRAAGGPLDPSGATSISIPCPPRAPYSLVLGARTNARPPFGIHLRPTEPPPSSGAHRS